MSREVRRVPLDFDFPLGDTWAGYLHPDELRLPVCADCHGHGWTAAHEWVSSIAHLLLMVGDDARRQRDGRDRGLHPYLANLENRPYAMVGPDHAFVTPRPTPDAVELSTGLAGRESDGVFGHDSIDHWRATEAIIKAAGLPEDWGKCATCAGEGEVSTPEQKAAYEAWTATDPPTGPGYQLWQTVSEGGPVSPVYATPEELADWIIASGKNLHGSNTPRPNLIRWITEEGSSVGSFAFTGGAMVSGVELAAGAS